MLGKCTAVLVWCAVAAAAQTPIPRARLAEALGREDLDDVRKIVAQSTAQLGAKAGEPEVPDQFAPIPDTPELSRDEARAAFLRYNDTAGKQAWWKIGLDPTQLTHALREPASMVSGGVDAYVAKLDGGERSLALARQAADFLIWAQQQAGSGVYPFPAYRGPTRSVAFLSAAKYLREMEKQGRLDKIVRNGWVMEDTGDGGLQFDNGEAGVAVLKLYQATHDRRYLDSVVKSADWAAARPLVPNWNYNSFSVYLLASVYAETHEAKYLAAAKKKALIGVIPGQLANGPRAGRWVDAHNARPAYHYIMLRALTALAAVLPAGDPDREAVVGALRLGLKVRNPDFIDRGAPSKDTAIEALIAVHRAFATTPALLSETHSDQALERLGKLLSAEYRSGRMPVGPGPWGRYLREIYLRSAVR